MDYLIIIGVLTMVAVFGGGPPQCWGLGGAPPMLGTPNTNIGGTPNLIYTMLGHTFGRTHTAGC